MDDIQMEKVIADIRENESRTQSLSETLMAFNESFKDFLNQIEAVGKLRDFEVSHEKITSLEEHIAGIKEDLELINTAQMVRLNELERGFYKQLNHEFKENLKTELKKELKIELKKEMIKESDNNLAQKQSMITVEKRILMGSCIYEVQEEYKVVARENAEGKEQEAEILYVGDFKILGIQIAYDVEFESKLIVYLENGEVHIA